MAEQILYADSDDEFRSIMSILLESMGYEVFTATLGTEALAVARTMHFDLYIIEMFLLDGSGIGLCRRLRLEFPRTPALLISGLDRCLEISEDFDGRRERYTIMPNDPTQLEKLIRRCLRSSRNMRLVSASG